MEARECEGDSSAQVGHHDTVLAEGNEGIPAYGCASVPPRLVLFSVPVATEAALLLFLKKVVGLARRPVSQHK